MKNKLFIVLPILLVGLVGCGGKGGNKNKETPIEFPEWNRLALKAEEKNNPNKYASALGYEYDYMAEERYDFALEDKYSLNEEGNLEAIEGKIAYRDDFVYDIVNWKASLVENNEACVYYKKSNGGLGFYYVWPNGLERYEFDKYGRLERAVTKLTPTRPHDDRRMVAPIMLADMDMTVTWSKNLVESKSYYLGFDAGFDEGFFENNKCAKILQFPKTTDKAFIDVLHETQAFNLGKQGGWICRSFGIHDEYQTINQSLVYDIDYITNFHFGVFTFDENTTEITVEFTVQVGYEACVQLQFGEGTYQKVIYPAENDYVEKVTLKYGNYVEPRAKRNYHSLFVYGKVYSVAFANQNGLFNRQNAGLIYADYNFSETWTANVPSYAFNGCTILENIDWPGLDAYMIYVARAAFYNCGQYMWQLELTAKLHLDDYALEGCTAVILFNLSKIPNNTEDPGYEAWRTLPSAWGGWSDTFDGGFEGHFTYEAWDDFICECQGESEYTFAIYWEETMDSLQVQLGDLLGHTTVVVYDDAFNELKEMEFNSENHYTDVYSYQANEWIYITVTHTSTDNPDVFFTFTTY